MILRIFISIILLFLIACSKNPVPSNDSEELLLIKTHISSNGKLLSGNDSLISILIIESTNFVHFNAEDMSIILSNSNINIDNAEVIILCSTTINSSSIQGNLWNIATLNSEKSVFSNHLFIDETLTYEIQYLSPNGSAIVKMPCEVEYLLPIDSTINKEYISIDTTSATSLLTRKKETLIYEYTHTFKFINYGYTKKSKIKYNNQSAP